MGSWLVCALGSTLENKNPLYKETSPFLDNIFSDRLSLSESDGLFVLRKRIGSGSGSYVSRYTIGSTGCSTDSTEYSTGYSIGNSTGMGGGAARE